MNVIKRMLAWFSAFVLLLSLVGLAWSYIGNQTIRDKDTVKSWLENAGLYDNIVETVLETAKQDTRETENTDLPVDDPAIKEAATSAFNSDYLKSTTETVINSVYDWLENEDQPLEFKIDVSKAKNAFIDSLGDYAVERAAKLPTCTSVTDAQNFDGLNAKCVPPGISSSQIATITTTQLKNNDQFFETTTFTQDDIKFGDSEQPFASSDEAARFKRSYRLSSYALWVFVMVGIAAAAGLIFLSPRKLSGLRRTGATFTLAGIILGISYGAAKVAESISAKDISTPTESAIGKSVLAGFIREISADIAALLIWFVMGYIVLGVVILVAVYMKNKQQTDNTPSDPKNSEPTPSSSSNSTNTSNDTRRASNTPKSPTKPAKKPVRKIQL